MTRISHKHSYPVLIKVKVPANSKNKNRSNNAGNVIKRDFNSNWNFWGGDGETKILRKYECTCPY